MKKLMFSVAISVYKNDNAEHFDTALDSITEKQSVKPDEIVLVVDGPVSDDINAVIKKYEGNYNLKVIRFEKNQGLGIALKNAVENASNDIIARMDSDDIALPDRFEQQLKCFYEDSDLDIVGGDISEFIGAEDNIVSKRRVPLSDKDIKEYMKTRCAMNHVSVMFKKDAVLKVGNYVDWFWNEDYYLWIRMWEAGCFFKNTGTVLVNVRIGADMYKRRGGMKYFKSEKGLQRYMLDKHLIGYRTYMLNIIKRLVLQVLMPNSLRGWVFKRFARK